ncbi:hypothetical protein AMAG_20387 [Allomyces macrogynus ATCC 38327]|uniref:GTP-eEF1A C-terminal domain-containing protein n=1 Tax=Allomyces macrogynus (strain ATCC 38327) TaxID=578462 RepID=A0A0L0TA25_ALLM3|nr:hypothetical protein AMAG_20387 [Allomyces macrogynus ATCC 38327]|eukprot:KNE71550.1 hypothetical protein AMAG_20387 [Allomyces macrogynus ATCC 38327]
MQCLPHGHVARAWYADQPCLLDTLPVPTRPILKPLRMLVTDSTKGGMASGSVTVWGRIEQGSMQIGDSVMLMPLGQDATVRHIEAKILAFELKVPLPWAGTFVIPQQQQGTLNEPEFDQTFRILDKADGSVIKKNPRVLTTGATALVELSLDRPVCLEAFTDCKEFGRFMLRKGGETIAAGVVSMFTFLTNTQYHPPSDMPTLPVTTHDDKHPLANPGAPGRLGQS